MKRSESNNCVITSLYELESVRNEWAEIYEGNVITPHYLSFEYVNLWYSCFASPNRIRVYRIVDNGITIGFLPLVLINKYGFNILKSITNYHCMHSGPLIRIGYEYTFSLQIMDELLNDKSTWDVFCFEYLYTFVSCYDFLSNEILNNRDSYWIKTTIPTYITNLDISYENYISSLSKKLKNNIKTWRKRLAKIGNVNFRVCQNAEAIDKWQEFLKLEDSGWKGIQGSSLKRADKNYRNYYEKLIKLLEQRGLLVIYLLEVNEIAIAGVFGYFENNIFHYWKIGYDEKYKEMSPSHILFLHIIESLKINCPYISRLHAFSGDFGYKQRYSNEEAYCSELTLYNKTIFGKVACYFNKAKQTAKNYALINKTVEHFRKLRSSK